MSGVNEITGTDEGDLLPGTPGPDLILGLDGDDNIDLITESGGPDDVRGGLGNDTIALDAAALGSVIDGGDGSDEVVFSGLGKATIDLANNTLTTDAALGAVTLASIENAWGDAGDDSIIGDAGANHLWGLAGADSLDGGAGDDTLQGGGGDDTLDGSNGLDIAAFSGARDDYTVTNGEDERGFYTLVADKNAPDGDGRDKLYNVETLEFGDGETTAICFMPGTLIATPGGEACVETLRRGDLVLTAEGRSEPVAWMGRQTVSRRFADPLRALPVRIRAGALGDGLPKRDLLVSPDHALFLDGVLVHAGALVNGSTIRRETGVPERWIYWHVELAGHALVLAEGVPAETFVDNAERMNFDNWAEHQALHPEGLAMEEMPLPRAKSPRQVPSSLRRRIATLAGRPAA